MNINPRICSLLALLAGSSLLAQVAKTQVHRFHAEALGENGLRLEWKPETYSGTFRIYKRNLIHTNGDWGSPLINISGTSGDTSWTDPDLLPGQAMEYLVAKVNTSGGFEAFGFTYAGNEAFRVAPDSSWFFGRAQRGHMLLLIDSAYIGALSQDIQELRENLLARGWFSDCLYAGRGESAAAVKTRILAFCNQSKFQPSALYIIGHVPVPYSGYFSNSGDRPPPDGHVEGVGNHTGAWPADAYYGDLKGNYTDETVSCTTGNQTRHHNVPGDGKFDQSVIANQVELDMGRADFYQMDAFNKDDTALTRQYLRRSMDWHYGLKRSQFEKIALIDNNFTGLNLASSGYHNFAALLPLSSTNDAADYLSSQKNRSYLWSYGCGAGSYTSCNGVGTSAQFAAQKDSFFNAFTMLAGSYFGDWDIKNNLMRSALAAGSLSCFWGGIPKWYVHHMGMGMHMGYGARITQNNVNDYFNGSFNGSWKGVFIALMGDPTLEMSPSPRPGALRVQRQLGSNWLRWDACSETVAGYNVYRVDTVNRIWYQLNREPLTELVFEDRMLIDAGTLYAVRSVELIETGSGTYWQTSAAQFGSTRMASGEEWASPSLSIYPQPSQGEIQIAGLPIDGPWNWELLDASGRMLHQGKVNSAAGQAQLKWAVSPGIYSLSLELSSVRFSQPLIIQTP